MSEMELEAGRESFRAIVRAALALAYSKQVRKGHTYRTRPDTPRRPPMTQQISEAALAAADRLANDVQIGGGYRKALARFIQTTSDAARAALDGYNDAYCPASHLEKHLSPLMLLAPDPLTQAWNALWPSSAHNLPLLKAELERLGATITFARPGDEGE